MSHRKLVSTRWRLHAGVLGAAAAAMAGTSVPASAAGGPSLGAARSFAALAGSTVASTGLTVVTGNVGVSPGTAVTGFPPGTVTGAIHAGDTAAAAAHADASLAYAFLAGMPSIPANNRSGVDLGGLTLSPGVYTFNTSAQLTGDLTLDAGGDSGALFVFQIGSTLTTSSNSHVTVINGGADYDESNVFWQVGSSATLGSGTAFTGNILAYASITLVTGATMTGDALALVGGVTLQASIISSPAPGAPPVQVPGSPAAPTNTTVTPIAPGSGSGSTVSWTDASSNETVFRVFRRDGAGPDFVQVGEVATTSTSGTGAVSSFEDQVLDPSTTYTYRVTAFSPTDGESVPSNEVRVGAAVGPAATRVLALGVGRGRSALRDRNRIRTDSVFIRETYSVIDVSTGLPAVLGNVDPRIDGITVQVRAPGSMIFLHVPAGDPRWKASKKGVYTWRTHDGKHAPVTTFAIDTRRSEFTLKSNGNDFGSVPVNSITVSLVYLNAAGSDVRVWSVPTKMPHGYRALFTLPK